MIIVWWVFAILGFICRVFSINEIIDTNLLSTLIITILSLVYVIAISIDVKNKKYWFVFVGTYLFRVFLLFWDLNYRHIFLLPSSGFDSEMFANAAQNGYYYAEFGRGGYYAKFIVNFIYQFFGEQRIIAQYVNILLSISAIFICKKILERLKIKKNVIYTSITIMAFIPNFAILSSILLRESLIIFLIALSIDFFIRWWQKNQMFFFILAICFALIATMIHSGAIAAVLGYLIAYILYDRKSNKIKFEIKSVFLLVSAIAFFFVLNTSFGDQIFAKFNGYQNIEDVMDAADGRSAGGAAYDIGIKTGNQIVDLLINTPLRMFYFIVAPLPWDWRGISDIIAFCFSSLVYGYYISKSYKCLKNNETGTINTNNKKTILFIFMIIVLSAALIFAWGTSNSGAALRHRDKFIVPFIILLALYQDIEKN